MDNEELEKQYSPSRWSVRGDADYVLSEYCRFSLKESDRSRAEVPCQLEVRVGPGANQMVDFYGGSDLPADAPVLVFVHGGYWQDLSRHVSAYCVRPLHQAGVLVAVPGYDLAPTVKVADIVEQITTSIGAILKYARERGSKSVWLCGHSAGAHLCATVLWSLGRLPPEHRALLSGLVLVSGVFDLTPLVRTYVNDALRLTRDEAAAVSPMLKPPSFSDEVMPLAKKLKVLIAVGEHESPEFHRQSQDYMKVLQKFCEAVEYYQVPNVDHFDIVENLHNDSYPLTRKIIHLIKNSSS